LDWTRLRNRFSFTLPEGWGKWAAPLGVALLVGVLLSPGLVHHAPVPSAARNEGPSELLHLAVPQADPSVLASIPSSGEAAYRESATVAGETREDVGTRFDCVIEPSELVELGSPVTGVIEKLYVERGEYVTAGKRVARLESGVEQAAVELARARGELEGALKAREANYELGQRRSARVSQLYESNTLSADLLDQVETEARIARLDLLEAEENRRLASLELNQARALLRRRTVRSPVDGVVVSRAMSVGEVVVDEKTIVTIARIDPLRVEVILPSALYGTVVEGQRAAVEPELGDHVHIASVEIVDGVIDAASGTFGVRLLLPNPEHAIPGGLHCQVRFLSQ